MMPNFSRAFLIISALHLALALSGPAQAQDATIDQGDFQTAPLPSQGNEDSVSVNGLSMGTPSYRGSGCPQGSVSSSLSPDQRTLSVLFDAYTSRVSGASREMLSRVNCSLEIPFQVPPGFRVQVVQMDYRGFASLAQQSLATVSATAFIRGSDGRFFPGHKEFRRGAVIRGPQQNNFMLTSRFMGPPWSACGQPFTLVANSELGMRTNDPGESIASIDSLDAVALPVKLNLRWQRCTDSPQPLPPPSRDGRDDRRGRDDHGGRDGRGGRR
jgi:hypothetical protein